MPATRRPASLREAAKGTFRIGTAIMSRSLDDPRFAAVVAGEFDTITAENEFKPALLQPERGRFTFDAADKLVAFAERNEMAIVGHTLCWHNQTPKWFYASEDGSPLSRDAALGNLRTHIQTVTDHFRGKAIGWDVVNEAISDSGPDDLRDTPARRAIGDDFVQKAFEFAHAADPNVELYYNDYNIELPEKRDKTLRLVRKLKSAGVRLDGVGIQGHWLLKTPDLKTIEDAIVAFGREGVKVMITELDVDVLPRNQSATADLGATATTGGDPYTQGLPDDVQRELGHRYADLFKLFLRHKDLITRVTFWGVDDGSSWLNGFPIRGRTNHPLLFDRQLARKPAYDAVIGAFS